MSLSYGIGEREVDVNIQAPPDGEESVRPLAWAMMKNGKTVGKVYLLFSRCTPKGAFSGPLFVTVTRIEGFGDTAGFMDKTDPLVTVEIGRQKQSTSCKVCVRARERQCVCACECVGCDVYTYNCGCVCLCVCARVFVCGCAYVCVQENAGGSVQFDEVLVFNKTLQDCTCKIRVL